MLINNLKIKMEKDINNTENNSSKISTNIENILLFPFKLVWNLVVIILSIWLQIIWLSFLFWSIIWVVLLLIFFPECFLLPLSLLWMTTPLFWEMNEIENKNYNLNDNINNDSINNLLYIYFIWNLISTWLIWTLFIWFYLLLKRNKISLKEKNIYNNIMNFSLSYLLYFLLSFWINESIWMLVTPILVVMWLVFLIIWFVKHLSWENYEYPLSIKFLK